MKTVLVNGCFDVLHVGHAALLCYAKCQGDRLIVAIDTDARVAAAKGPDRPYNTESDRRTMLLSLRWVDDVVSFGTDDELRELTKRYQPNIMVVGSDWEGLAVIGSENAGEVLYFNRLGSYSTTNILSNRK